MRNRRRGSLRKTAANGGEWYNDGTLGAEADLGVKYCGRGSPARWPQSACKHVENIRHTMLGAWRYQ